MGVYQLTKREKEVACLASEGHTNEIMSRELGITIPVIEHHLLSVYEKMALVYDISGKNKRVLLCKVYKEWMEKNEKTESPH